jgi:hypothetical protein
LLQPGFAYAGPVAVAAVSSYLTFSPLPELPVKGAIGGCFLWHCP